MTKKEYSNENIKLVLAGNPSEFKRLLLQYKPEDRIFYRYITGPDKLLGMNNYELVFYGTWFAREDIYEIKEVHEMRKRGSNMVKGDFP